MRGESVQIGTSPFHKLPSFSYFIDFQVTGGDSVHLVDNAAHLLGDI